MSSALDKVQQIISEIEPVEMRPKTANDIADILLGKKDTLVTTVLPVKNDKKMNSIDWQILEERLRQANETWNIQYYRPIYSCRPILGKFIVFFKRMFRKIAKFLIEPIIAEQVQFNSAAVNSLNSLRNNNCVFENSINEIYNLIENNNEKKINELIKQMDIMQEKNVVQNQKHNTKKRLWQYR